MSQLTIEDIACLAGISRSRVSGVLNNYPNVRASIRRRVPQVIDEQGCAPHVASQQLTRRYSQVIRVIVPQGTDYFSANPFHAAVTRGIRQVCEPLPTSLAIRQSCGAVSPVRIIVSPQSLSSYHQCLSMFLPV